MATFNKQGKRWRVRVRCNGVSKSNTFDTKREARAWADDIEAGYDTGTLFQAFDRYRENESPKHKGYRMECLVFDRMKREFDDVDLRSLTPTVLAKWRDKRLKVVQGSSINRNISLLNAVFNLAIREWGWLSENPLNGVRKPKNPAPRRRGITQSEIDLILKTNKWCGIVEAKRDQVSAAFLIGIETAMRASEILRADIDLDRRVATLIETKNGDKRLVPLSTKAVEVYRAVGVFTISPESLSTLFRRVKHDAGLSDLHFHDTRAEGITRLSKKLDVLQLAKIIGHRDIKSLLIYYSETADDIVKLLD